MYKPAYKRQNVKRLFGQACILLLSIVAASFFFWVGLREFNL